MRLGLGVLIRHAACGHRLTVGDQPALGSLGLAGDLLDLHLVGLVLGPEFLDTGLQYPPPAIQVAFLAVDLLLAVNWSAASRASWAARAEPVSTPAGPM